MIASNNIVLPGWQVIVERYQTPDRRKAVGQACNSFIPFFLTWAAMAWSLGVSYWLTLALAPLAAGFLVRIFIIQHDCGHGSFLSSRRISDALGFACGVLTLTPYRMWRSSHAIHHAGASNLDRRGVGDINTLTVAEYAALPGWRRLLYRLYRHPFFLFPLASGFSFAVLQRFCYPPQLRRERASLHWTNLAIAGVVTALVLGLGWRAFLMVHLPVLVLSAATGTWLFYVQHQFRDSYWVRGPDWDFSLAALRGSSFYRLPAVLRWFTGNIGYHHIHHLSPRIANYALRRCHEENPSLRRVTVLTLRSSLATARLKLWDESRQQMVGFGAVPAR